MKILQQTPQKLVIGTPASALFWVRLMGLAVSSPGLLLLALFLLGGMFDYASLHCQRHRPPEQQCRFLRVSLVRPTVQRFAADDLTGVQQQQTRSGNAVSQRLVLEMEGRDVPLTVYYSDNKRRQAAIAAQVQEFIDVPAISALTVRSWPSWGSIVILIAVFIPTVPLSLLIIFVAATSVTLRFDKGQNQLTVAQTGFFHNQTKQCALSAIAHIKVEHLVIDRSHRGKSAIERYPLIIGLHSGEKFFRFDYIQRQFADDIAQVIRRFLDADKAPQGTGAAGS